MFKRLAEFVLITKWPIFLAIALSTVITGYYVFRLQIDPSIESLFDKNTPDFHQYRYFNRQFGSDEMIAVAMETDDLFRIENLRHLRGVTKKISNMDGVERVLSLSNARDIRHKFLGIRIAPVLKDVYNGEKEPSEVRDEILSNELYLHNLISKNGKVANLLIYLEPISKSKSSQGKLIEDLKRLFNSYTGKGIRFYMAGAPVEHYEFIRLIKYDQLKFVPLIVIILIVTIMTIYGSFSCMVFSMAAVLVSLVWTMGTISILGQQLNLVTALLAPVVMIVALANSIHIMNLFFEIRPHHPSLRKSVVLTIEQTGVPNFLAHLTTVLGFISLALNSVPAIQSFGLFAALGTVYSYLVMLFVAPLLLMLLPYRPKPDHTDEGHFFNRFLVAFLEKFEFQWKWWIVGGTILVIFVSIMGIQRLQVDTNIVKQMKPDSELAKATRFIDENVTGVYSLGFILRRRDGKPISDYESLRRIDEFKTFLESCQEISNVNSVTTLIKKIHMAREENPDAYRIPKNEDLLRRYFRGISESKDEHVWSLITKDFEEIRLDARMRAVGTREGAEMENKIRAYLEVHMKDRFDYYLTGSVVILGKMAVNLVHNQMQGFAFAFASILIVITIVNGSIRIGLLAAIPNLIPILAVYGLMGFLSIELSTPTAMISSIVLGMVVDSSIYFLHRFRYEFLHRHHYLQALHHTYRQVGQALVVSTFILVCGFASSVFASFRPTVHFGLLTSCAIFFALVCTLLVLPVALVLLKAFGPVRLFKKI